MLEKENVGQHVPDFRWPVVQPLQSIFESLSKVGWTNRDISYVTNSFLTSERDQSTTPLVPGKTELV